MIVANPVSLGTIGLPLARVSHIGHLPIATSHSRQPPAVDSGDRMTRPRNGRHKRQARRMSPGLLFPFVQRPPCGD